MKAKGFGLQKWSFQLNCGAPCHGCCKWWKFTWAQEEFLACLKKRNKKKVSKYTEAPSALRSHWATDGCRIVVTNPVMISCLLYSKNPFWTSGYYPRWIFVLTDTYILLIQGPQGLSTLRSFIEVYWSTIHLHQPMSCPRSLKMLMAKLQIKQNCLTTFTHPDDSVLSVHSKEIINKQWR